MDVLQAPLSARQIDVLQLVAFGMSNVEIAERLDVSRNTVKRHLQSVSRKWGMGDRAGMAAHALRHGVIS